jgi:hypothetical protein
MTEHILFLTGSLVMQNLYKVVIGENKSPYYLDKFQQFDQLGLGLTISWNWSAFLVSGLWLLYRKIYLWFFAYWIGGGSVVYLVIFSRLDSSIAADIILFLIFALHLFFGIYGNSIYHKSVNKKIAAAQLIFKDEEQLVNALYAKGGVSAGGVWAFLVSAVALILFMILAVVFGVLGLFFEFFNTVFCHGGCF